MTSILRFVAIMSLSALAWAAGGLQGKWSGTIAVSDPGGGDDISTTVELQLDAPQAGVISGKIGREGDTDAVTIRNGKLEGGHVYFEAASSETSGPMKFDLRLEGDRLVGRMKGAVESHDIEGSVTLTREN